MGLEQIPPPGTAGRGDGRDSRDSRDTADSGRDVTPLAIHVGIDLAAGRTSGSDFTAICVAEVLDRIREGAPLPPPPYRIDDIERETFYRVQLITRLPHGLTWPQIGAAVVALLVGIYDEETARLVKLASVGIRGERLPRVLYADRTGLGDALMGILEQALADEPRTRDVDVLALSFVHGEKLDRVRGVVGKLRLISRLQALLATDPKRVELPRRDPIIPTLLAELDAYHMQIDRDGHETLGGIGAHDDLVTALALATVEDPNAYTPRDIRLVYVPPGRD